MDKPKARTAAELLDEIAERHPQIEAVVDGKVRWTYGQLRDEARITAVGLWALDIRPGDRVALLMGNRAEWLAAYFAILGLGAHAVALNTWLTPSEQVYQLNHAGVRTLIVEQVFGKRNFVQELSEMRTLGLKPLQNVIVVGCSEIVEGLAFEALPQLAAKIPAGMWDTIWSAAKPDDVACILYTSGSTARPKGVPLQHCYLIDNMWAIGERMHLQPGERLWTGVSLFWSFGCVNALFTMMTHGGCLVLQHHFDSGEALALIEKERCTVIYGTPNMAAALMVHPHRRQYDLSSLRTGATIGTPEQIQMFVDLGAVEICNVYGLTEAYGNSCVTDCKAPLELRLQSCGPPLEGVRLQIINPETGESLSPGEAGEIVLKGHTTFGYLNDPETTAASFTRTGYLRTGDLGYLDEAGWLHFQGRIKELIKSGGINIAPAEIEATLRSHHAVESAFVVGLPDPELDQVIGSVILLNDPDEPITGQLIKDLQDHCRKSLARYKVPQQFVFTKTSDLPVTSTAKIQRSRLPALFS